ncbi:hypothetical protein C7S16_2826 [Burkholderia thailandensis]|uniref:Uncharacterized protein n=1 Tax=Burkholderia thailandensis TaxID=57975 RepID=A0AAW9D1B4_BURTH|nr:hypothetical protein WI24_14295 [Burkholderia thailandensis]AOJ51849.1 hypothetical protein AQ475_14180 [Burkholderia thailandensis]MDW9241296.1 hypothetical protein [Burkholderia thailandensis]MDW9254882.1 hypothetical protein [Burkholderia thailandensis]
MRRRAPLGSSASAVSNREIASRIVCATRPRIFGSGGASVKASPALTARPIARAPAFAGRRAGVRACRLPPAAFRLSPVACRLSPVACRLSPVAHIGIQHSHPFPHVRENPPIFGRPRRIFNSMIDARARRYGRNNKRLR